MDSKIIKIFLFFLIPLNSFAAEFQGSFKQGSFILGKTTPNSKVFIDNREVKVTKDGFFVFGLSRDRKNNVLIKISKNGDTKIIEKKVFKRKYKIQRIDGLPENKVTPPEEVYKRIKKENNAIGEARAINSDLNYFKSRSEDENTKHLRTEISPYNAMEGAHAIAVLTEWDEFKSYDWQRIYKSMQKPAFIFDGRNVLDRKALETIGFIYKGIGS